MDEFLDKAGAWLNKAIEFAKTMTIEEWGYVAGGLIILLLLRWIIRRARRPEKIAVFQGAASKVPGLQLHTFQIAPLGRDAFLKIQNTGEEVTLTKLEINDRANIHVKNALAGHKIDKGKIYGVLLEAIGNTKLTDGFKVKLTFLNKEGKVGTAEFVAFQTKVE